MARPTEPYLVPRGLPTTWPAGEPLDAMVEIDDIGCTDLWLPVVGGVSQSDAAALSYVQRFAIDVQLTHSAREDWRCDLTFRPRDADGWEADGEGATVALAIAHALVQCSDEEIIQTWALTSVRWYDPAHDEEDEDYDGEELTWCYEDEIEEVA